MTRIIVDDTLRSKLHDFSEPLELCDNAGRVLARLTPVYSPDEYGPLQPQVSEKELQRRQKSSQWFSTQEVLEYLNGLGKTS